MNRLIQVIIGRFINNEIIIICSPNWLSYIFDKELSLFACTLGYPQKYPPPRYHCDRMHATIWNN